MAWSHYDHLEIHLLRKWRPSPPHGWPYDCSPCFSYPIIIFHVPVGTFDGWIYLDLNALFKISVWSTWKSSRRRKTSASRSLKRLGFSQETREITCFKIPYFSLRFFTVLFYSSLFWNLYNDVKIFLTITLTTWYYILYWISLKFWIRNYFSTYRLTLYSFFVQLCIIIGFREGQSFPVVVRDMK